jgi:hypothetical protein
VQNAIYFIRQWRPRAVRCPPPCSGKRLGCLSTALKAWAVPGGQGGGLVEKKQLGVAPGCHHGAAPLFERQDASNPALGYPAASSQFTAIVV